LIHFREGTFSDFFFERVNSVDRRFEDGVFHDEVSCGRGWLSEHVLDYEKEEEEEEEEKKKKKK
jgi:hypothetical protein